MQIRGSGHLGRFRLTRQRYAIVLKTVIRANSQTSVVLPRATYGVAPVRVATTAWIVAP